MKREARVLKGKAVSSLRRASATFNSPDDDGRVTSVLLHLQHAFEMLLKAALVERGRGIMDPATKRSIGLKKCLNLSSEHLGLTAGQVGTIRAIDAMRDDEQHYIGLDDEPILYLHARAGITIFDEILRDVFQETLADVLPLRVLPISTEPPQSIDVLIDSQFHQISQLLQPGNRRRDEARRKIRTLLALEGHQADEVAVSERDVDRVERGIRDGKSIADIFPRLDGLETSVAGTGLTVTVKISKREGAPVRYVAADADVDAAAIREVDLERTFHMRPKALADRLGITGPKSTALRWQLEIDTSPRLSHEFVHGPERIRMFSDAAFVKMRDAISEGLDWRQVLADWRRRDRAATT